MTMRYVALLRGINVGGNNLIKMAELRAALEGAGYTEVATLIASGNVVFSAGSKAGARAQLTEAIEGLLGARFAYESKIVLLSAKELGRVIEEAPPGFGSEPSKYRYNVLFVRAPMTVKAAMVDVEANPDVDVATAGKHAIYFRNLLARASASRLAKIVGRPIYRSITIRNWNTTQKLAAMAGA